MRNPRFTYEEILSVPKDWNGQLENHAPVLNPIQRAEQSSIVHTVNMWVVYFQN